MNPDKACGSSAAGLDWTSTMTQSTPFHDGEIAAQIRAGADDVASWAADFIRNNMPQQHRDFYTSLPCLVVSAADENGRPWVTVLEGCDGFIAAPNSRELVIEGELQTSDPLASAMATGTDIGVLGIELATRRRNRLSGLARSLDGTTQIEIRQAFGNCPQHIHEREWFRMPSNTPGHWTTSDGLLPDQIALIEQADTMFIGTGQQGEAEAQSNGYDASHRGGEPGFVKVIGANRLRIPDYAGNNFFNTIGNLINNPRLGLLFIDFATGSMLHVSGTATIDWQPEESHDPAARRMIEVTVEQVINRPSALSLRWKAEPSATRKLVVAGKVAESSEITSLYLLPKDNIPLEPFQAGQHLPISLDVPGERGRVGRSYSLSGSPQDEYYRLSIKREAKGVASRYVHDQLSVGDLIEVGRPSGEFVLPSGTAPLVLVSAGVGITPVISMLHDVAHQSDDRSVWFIHGARNSQNHALREEVDSLLSLRQSIYRSIHYSQPLQTDKIGKDFDVRGRINPDALISLEAGSDAIYMLCGPTQFLAETRAGLESRGVPGDQIHFESFGPGS